MNYACKECGFNLWLPIGDKDNCPLLKTSYLGLYNDGRFPGRSLLVLDVHEEELALLSPLTLSEFMEDVQVAGRAIQKAVGALRMNYAILGNAVPHVHCHIIPRFGETLAIKQLPGVPKLKLGKWKMRSSMQSSKAFAMN